MTSALPDNLVPIRFPELGEAFYDKYNRRYTFTYCGWDFAVLDALPLRVELLVGFDARETDSRNCLTEILRIAQQIYDDFGGWPAINIEWGDMCPGELLRLDLTQLVERGAPSAALPKLMEAIARRLEAVRIEPGVPFAQAERHYQNELAGVAAFNVEMKTRQREFDGRPLCALNANTKARRLRYISVAVLASGQGGDLARIVNSVLSWASAHEVELEEYADPKGAIVASNGRQSAQPYIELAREMGLLTRVGRGLVATNEARVLALLKPSQESFVMSLEEKLYLLSDILEYDRDIVCSLLMFLSEHGVAKKGEIRAAFPSIYKKQLESNRRHCGTLRARRLVDDALGRIEKWKNAKVYMEHIVDPRVSWLVDLGLCKLAKDRVEMSDGGLLLSRQLRRLHDDDDVPITKEFLRARYIGTFGRCLLHEPTEASSKEKPSRKRIAALLEEYAEYVLRATKSLAPNRIVASTLFRYASIRFYSQYRIVGEFRDLAAFIGEKEESDVIAWRLRWQPAQNDGYLTRIKVGTTNN